MKHITSRHNPPRMAQRWKLVPTLRHKQCPNTMCGVYIGNGCRKCPKCKTEQPVTTKRKRSGSPVKARKKKTPQADGNPNAIYRTRDKVKVFWERYKRWTWGTIGAVYSDSNGRSYAVKLIGLRTTQLGQVWGDWCLQYVKSTHLKKRLTDDSKSYTQTRADVLYKDLIQVKSELGPVMLKHKEEAAVPYPSCACLPCMKKYYDAIYTGPKVMAPSLKNLKKGMIIKTSAYNSYDTIVEVVSLDLCRNPDYSAVMVRNVDPESRNFNSTTRMEKHHKWYHYTIHFEDNGRHQYFHDTTAHFQERLYDMCEKADKISEAGDLSNPAKLGVKDAFDYDMNNFTYRIELEVYTVIDDNNTKKFRYWTASQTNSKTKVKRQLYIGSLKKPQQKQLVDYQAKIESVIGKVHDWEWLNAEEAGKDSLCSGVKHPTRLRFLGMTKFNKDFVDLDARQSFYSDFNVTVRKDRLYHGTFMRNLFPILHPLGGFAMASESNGKCYGQGIYFAETPNWVHDNGYCPAGVDNIRCVLICDVLLGKRIINSTDTWHKNASVRGNTSEEGSSGDTSSVVFKPENFELTGGSTTRSIHVVWYDKCRTDINIKGVLFYK